MKNLALVLCCIAPIGALAQEATPNHVFQVVETAQMELRELNTANFSTAASVRAVPSEAVLPRHVYMQARLVFEKTHLLRYMNGLEVRSLGPIPARDLIPADGRALVDELITDVRDLRAAYGLPASAHRADLPTGKGPSDVYQALLAVDAELDGLGVPSTTPNDVYRAAATLRGAVLDLARARGITPAAKPERMTGKTPSDVYDEASRLIRDLADWAAAEGITVTGGIAVPPARSKPVGPDIAVIMMARALGDVTAMKVALGSPATTANAAFEGGKTPSDVFALVAQSRQIIGEIRAAGAAS